MENAALTSHQTVSAISASEANEIGLYSSDVISLSVEKKESLSTANSTMAKGPIPRKIGDRVLWGRVSPQELKIKSGPPAVLSGVCPIVRFERT